VFVDGEKTETLRGDDIVPRFLAILEDYVARRYPTPGSAAAAAAGVTDGVAPPLA
jgi:(E)-4-hydroxy-3-methylbut-2-enyl-diphosphate synthase